MEDYRLCLLSPARICVRQRGWKCAGRIITASALKTSFLVRGPKKRRGVAEAAAEVEEGKEEPRGSEEGRTAIVSPEVVQSTKQKSSVESSETETQGSITWDLSGDILLNDSCYLIPTECARKPPYAPLRWS